MPSPNKYSVSYPNKYPSTLSYITIGKNQPIKHVSLKVGGYEAND